LRPILRHANWTGDDNPVRIEVDADARRCAVLLILAEHEFKPALLDRVPLAGIKDRLELGDN